MRAPGDVDVQRLDRARPSRAANLVAAVLDPVVVVVLVLSGLAAEAGGSVLVAVGWVALTALFCVVIPYAVLLLLVRSGRVHDRQVVRRDQRTRPMLLAAASTLLGLLVLVRLGAPRTMVAYVVTLLAAMALLLALTRWTKASFHEASAVGSAAGAATLLGGGWWWALGVAIAALVGWARVRAGRHTLPEVLLGAAVGLLATWCYLRWR